MKRLVDWLRQLFTDRQQQSCSCWCQACGADLCRVAVSCVDPDPQGFVSYKCVCGDRSQWDFDVAPVPVFLRRLPGDAAGPG